MADVLNVTGNLTVFDIDLEDDGTYVDNLGFIQGVNLVGDLDTVDASPINRAYDRQQAAEKSVTISADLMSVKSGSVKVSTLDLSAFSFAGLDYLAYAESFEFGVNWDLKPAKGAASLWKYPQASGKKTLSFDGTIFVPTTAALGSQALATKFFSATPTDHDVTLDFTINGVQTTVAMTLKHFEKAFQMGDLQAYKVRCEANSPDSGTYPAAPTGTTTAFERALNTITRHRLRLTDHASEGQQYAGLAVLRSAVVKVGNSGLVMIGYEWESQGAWTSTPN